MMIALDFALGPTREIVIAGEEHDEKSLELVRGIYSRFIPNKVVAFHPAKGNLSKKIETLSPFMKNQVPVNGTATIYVCKNYVCDLPVTEVSQLERLLE